MKVLVVGGAGYVGSHAVRALKEAGHEAWVLDNLCQGHRAAVPAGRLIEGDLMRPDDLAAALDKTAAEAVMHFAALSLVGESVAEPAKYYQNNVVGTLNLLDAMRTAGVWRLVFSSTAATYGTPESSPILENAPQLPINPYGRTKLAIEQALDSYAAAYDFGFAALRYFNAAGAHGSGDIGEDHSPETHLIPIVLQVALGQREHVTIYGNDYPTPDGTCVRDYIHVEDLCTRARSGARATGAWHAAKTEPRHGARFLGKRSNRSLPHRYRPRHSRSRRRPPPGRPGRVGSQ